MNIEAGQVSNPSRTVHFLIFDAREKSIVLVGKSQKEYMI
jgi:hypothetical protein